MDMIKHQLADPTTVTAAPDAITETNYPATDVTQQVDNTLPGKE